MLSEAERDRRNLRKYLRDLTKAVELHVAALDAIMKSREGPDRGRRVAALANGLELQNDMAKRFGLGIVRKRTRGPE